MSGSAKEGSTAAVTVYTVGHSTNSMEGFVQLLQAHGVAVVVDVRTVPRSRHNPQFNQDSLPGDLREHGIGYRHLKGLGGLRHSRVDSPNTGWHNASFRGFADYMQTQDFADALGDLVELARKETAAIMCAEAVPWRCHRSLIADALLVRGHKVVHIMGAKSGKEHALTAMARVAGTAITYPAE